MAEALFTPLCERLLEDGQAVRFQASGVSMHPAIRDGEWLTVEPVAPNSVKRGEVALYRSRRGLTAHRVRRIVAADGVLANVVFRGDNAGAWEESVEPDGILGRVVSAERAGRRFDPSSPQVRLGAWTWRAAAGLVRGAAALAARMKSTLHNGLRRRSIARQGGLS